MKSKATFAEKAITFYKNLNTPEPLTGGVSFMNPYAEPSTMELVEEFFTKFYSDSKNRRFIIGINPGRFGAGVTGIGFTDPINLETYCGIQNNLGEKPELSSRFVYKVIESFGGPEMFFRKYFISSVYPLALIKDAKNYNYYDSLETFQQIKESAVGFLKQQIEFGADRSTAICFGKKNAKFLTLLNDEHGFFDRIEVLDHPRFIMQYRLKRIDEYLDKYLNVL